MVLLTDEEKAFLFDVGYQFYKMGDAEEAIKFLQVLGKYQFYSIDNVEEALRLLPVLRSDNSDRSDYYFFLAECQRILGRYNEAINNYKIAMGLLRAQNDLRSLDCIFRMIHCRLAQGNPKRAIVGLTELINLSNALLQLPVHDADHVTILLDQANALFNELLVEQTLQ